MPQARTLYDKAVANFKSAVLIFDNREGDEEQLNACAYHLQQSVEFALKYLLEQNGIEYPKTHDIETLIRIGTRRNAYLYLTAYIEDHAEMFSQWEAKSRYIIGYLVEERKIAKAIPEIGSYLEKIAVGEEGPS